MPRKRQPREQHWWDWINEKNNTQVDWAHQYLRKKGLRFPYPKEDKPLLHRLELPPFQSQEEHDWFIDCMKRSWRAKETRDQAKKKRKVKALHVYLSEDALDALSTLSSRFRLHKNQYLDQLLINTKKSTSPKTVSAVGPHWERPSAGSRTFYDPPPQPISAEQPTPSIEELARQIESLQQAINDLRSLLPQHRDTDNDASSNEQNRPPEPPPTENTLAVAITEPAYQQAQAWRQNMTTEKIIQPTDKKS